MSVTYPALRRGVIVLIGARGLFVIAHRNEGLRGKLTLEVHGIERGNIADAKGKLHLIDNHGTLTVPGWKCHVVPTPTVMHREFANALLEREAVSRLDAHVTNGAP